MNLSDFEQARAALEEVPDNARDNFMVLGARAALAGRDNPDEAVTLFARAQAESPMADAFQVAEMRARFLVENGRPREAQAAINDAVERVGGGGGVPPALRALELRVLAKEDPSGEVAAEAEELIAESDAQLHADRIVDLSRALMDMGRAEAAAAHLENLLAEVANLRGAQAAHEAFVALGRDDDAAALKRRLEHLEGDKKGPEERKDVIRGAKSFVIGSSSDFLNQINAALAANDAETALGLYTQVIETGKPKLKNESRTHLNRGSLYFILKKYAEAADDFAKAEQLGKLEDKELALRAYQHAFALQRLGRHKDAIGELEKALGFDAKNLQYRSLQGHLLRRVKRLDEAEQVLTGLLRESPLQESAYFELADLKRRERNDNNGAIRILLSLLEVAPRNARAHRMLTDLYVSNGEPEKADQHREILRTL